MGKDIAKCDINEYVYQKYSENVPLFINGQFVSSTNKKTFETTNPATGGAICSLPEASKADVDTAVKSAQSAFRGWSHTPPTERACLLDKLASSLEEKADFLAEIENIDMGKPVHHCKADVLACVDVCRFNAKLTREIETYQDKTVVLPNKHFEARVRYEPFGVVGLITPWNFPLLMVVQKVAATLGTGNCCVLKPSENASLSTLEFAKILSECGFPNGVFNVVLGFGPTTGSAIVEHPLVRRVSFTGSVQGGKAVMRAAAETVKPVHLELGGKSAVIIMDDANIETATEWVVAGIFTNSGQVCTATSRILVHETVYEEVVKKIKAKTELLTVGPKTCDVGPVAFKAQYDKVMGFLKTASDEGLNCLTGGDVSKVPKIGYYVPPTVYRDVPVTSHLWTDEIFGPVLCVRPFKTEEEAIEVANNSDYGLAAAVFSKDETRQERIANALEAGIIWENASQPAFAEQPFGGYKQSGIGRECGREGFMEYLQIKSITRCHPDKPPKVACAP